MKEKDLAKFLVGLGLEESRTQQNKTNRLRNKLSSFLIILKTGLTRTQVVHLCLQLTSLKN